MLKRISFLWAVAGLLLFGGATDTAAQAYKVVVNAGNPVSSMPASDVANLFLKRTTRWTNGETVVAMDLPESSGVRAAFSEAVHGRSVSAIKAYWQRLIFSGRGVPPVEKASNAEVLSTVAGSSGAVGYVSGGASLPGGVKVLNVTN